MFDRLDNLSVGRKLCVCVAYLDDEAEDDDAGRADHGAEPGECRQLFGGVTVDGGRLCDATLPSRVKRQAAKVWAVSDGHPEAVRRSATSSLDQSPTRAFRNPLA